MAGIRYAAMGIIPACAGSTYGTVLRVWYVQGSSPHVRGAPIFREPGCRTGWIIPACAGSTRV